MFCKDPRNSAPRQALLCSHQPATWPVTKLRIFTDGSYQEGQEPGWARILVEECSDGHSSWLNYVAHAIGTTRALARQGLCNSADNIDGEAAALIFAACSWPPAFPVSIWSDCQCVVEAANGTISPPKLGTASKLCVILRQVFQVLKQEMPR